MNGNDGSDIWSEVLGWIQVASSDLRVVGLCLDAVPRLRDAAAYHCQQAAEKLLKGFLVIAGEHVWKTHDLDVLAGLVQTRFSVEHLVTP